MARLYRVENADGRGPYSAPYEGPYLRLGLAKHNGSARHPSLLRLLGRAGVEPDRSLHCAFASREDLESWFDGLLPALAEAGFRVVELEADVVAGPDEWGQVAFRREPGTSPSSGPVAPLVAGRPE